MNMKDPETIPTDEQSSNHEDHQVPLIQLELKNVTYSPIAQNSSTSSNSKRTTVLHNISTTIRPYQVSAWMGPSGSGKTSLLTVAAGLLPEQQQQQQQLDSYHSIPDYILPSHLRPWPYDAARLKKYWQRWSPVWQKPLSHAQKHS
mmetsp:Transcript_19016/g.52105  ORF Transcript_19016/g.52105 Transcript_19016/m.52105 type:complete len:146 (-) Transcript_19016:32-469(-)